MHLDEWLEQALDVVVTDANARVMHTHLQSRVSITVCVTQITLHTHFPLVCKLDRVGDNVHDDLTQALIVRLHALLLQLFATVVRARHLQI